MTDLIQIQVPPVSKEFTETLKKIFRPIEITPTTTLEAIYYNAGMLKVIKFIESNTIGKDTIGNPNDIVDIILRDSKPSFFQRLFGK